MEENGTDRRNPCIANNHVIGISRQGCSDAGVDAVFKRETDSEE